MAGDLDLAAGCSEVMVRRLLRGTGWTFIGMGSFVLYFLVYQLVGTNAVTSRGQSDLRSELQREWSAAPVAPKSDPKEAVPPKRVARGKALAVLDIPKIQLDNKVVVEGVGRDELRKGPGHVPSTVLPGQDGTFGVSGHRTTYGAPFYRLNELAKGDTITVVTREVDLHLHRHANRHRPTDRYPGARQRRWNGRQAEGDDHLDHLPSPLLGPPAADRVRGPQLHLVEHRQGGGVAMAWRGQGGGKRAKGRRGDQDPELDNTAWLAELEREAAAQADDDDEDDWASTLRGRRSSGPTSPPPPAPGAPDPGWAPSDPAPAPPSDYRHLGGDPVPAPGDPIPRPVDPDPRPAGTAPGPGGPLPRPAGTAPRPRLVVAASRLRGLRRARRPGGPGTGGAGPLRGAGAGRPTPTPDPAAFGEPRRDAGSGTDWDGPAGDQGDGGWRSAGVDTPTGTWSPVEPVGREPDYPALFGELYRRSAAQQDPIWEDAPDQPLPEPGQPDPAPSAWPFEETTQSWEPSDRSFIWPSDELPSTSAEWDQPTPRSSLDDPDPRPHSGPSAQTAAPASLRPDPVLPPEPDQTAAWPAPGPHASPSPGQDSGRPALAVGRRAEGRQRGAAGGAGRAAAGGLGRGDPDRRAGGQAGGRPGRHPDVATRRGRAGRAAGRGEGAGGAVRPGGRRARGRLPGRQGRAPSRPRSPARCAAWPRPRPRPRPGGPGRRPGRARPGPGRGSWP